MEGNTIDKDCSALGGLFQTIVNDMRNSSVIWEDFSSKASKLHTSLKATLGAIGMFLDAFQKVADMATGSRGATKEIGTALTRLCLRHKSIEAKLKALTSSIVDNLVTPVQEHCEEWKKTVAQLDKDHAKEYKRARTEIKKAASDTMRLQKKVKKGNSGKAELQSKLDNAMQDINDKYLLFEEAEKNAVRSALIEERGRYCIFVSCLRPFVEHEIGLITEITHLQDIMQSLCMQCSDPSVLPAASEQVIMDVKGFDSSSVWNFSQHSPPSSPSSIGSRKSSMCSISSINSSSSGSLKSHSPSHLNHKRNSAQQLPVGPARLTSVSSQDSGFTSQDTLFLRPATPSSLKIPRKDADNSQGVDNEDADSQSSTPSDNTPSASSTWTNWPNPPNQNGKPEENRPHTISTAYERNKSARPALSSTLFEPLGDKTLEEEEEEVQMRGKKKHERSQSGSGSAIYARPQSATINKMQPVLPPLAPKPKMKAVEPPKLPILGEAPAYVNMSDLANMAKEKQRDGQSDNDQTPTEKSPPYTMSNQLPIDLEEAIRDLDNATASLHLEFVPDEKQMRTNSQELAKAIQELEASTAALESTYDSNTSQSSLQCSSGYGTMNSTPAGSEHTIATGDDFDLNNQGCMTDNEKYFTIPRNSEIGIMYKAELQAKRPASTAGIPISHSNGAPITRRSSMNTPKPPPPVRRSSSITTANPSTLQKLRKTPPRQLPPNQGQPYISQQQQNKHRRSNSSGGASEPAYAELQTIQQSIHARHQQQLQQQHHAEASPYASTATQNIPYSAPATPSQYADTVLMPPPGGGYVAPPSSHQQGQTELMQKLNAKFQALNAAYNEKTESDSLPPPPPEHSIDPDLPPPPSQAELEEIEQIYSRPPPRVNPKPIQRASNTEILRTSQHSTNLENLRTSQHVGNPENLRASLVSELKMGLRRVSTNEEGTEC